jgi:hypothetical protein
VECWECAGQGGGKASSPRQRGTERAAVRSSVAAFSYGGGRLQQFLRHKSGEGEVREKFTQQEKARRRGSLKCGGDDDGGSKFGDSGGRYLWWHGSTARGCEGRRVSSLLEESGAGEKAVPGFKIPKPVKRIQIKILNSSNFDQSKKDLPKLEKHLK